MTDYSELEEENCILQKQVHGVIDNSIFEYLSLVSSFKKLVVIYLSFDRLNQMIIYV